MDTCVSAVQHLRRMRGGSQSHLLRASDGAHYVTKFMNNPQHVRVLANEMLATNLGLPLGLPMPRVEVIDVSDRLIENNDDLRMELRGASIPCSSGRQLASLYAGDTVDARICDYLPDEKPLMLWSASSRARAEDLMVVTGGQTSPLWVAYISGLVQEETSEGGTN
jgi:hypothetical protein